MVTLQNKTILLGVTGSIAAYKSAELIRKLREYQANIQVVMTQDAYEFITPLTLQALSGSRVYSKLLDHDAESSMSHITLAKAADLILIAPATANIMAKFAHGIADDLLSTLYLATTAPIAIAPAMNQNMWSHPATQKNKTILLERGVKFLGPAVGSQACGDFGLGRMLEPEHIVAELIHLFSVKSLENLKILITAGPTREPIDPVRYISNYSSGKMGYALAEAAYNAGGKVTLVTGPTSLPIAVPANIIKVDTAEQMYNAVLEQVKDCNIFIGAAAVADFRCDTVATQKIKKESPLSFNFVANPDIIKTVSKLKNRPYIVGFAAETENLIANARLKLNNKQLDMIVANQVGIENSGFNSDFNAATVLVKEKQIDFPHGTKQQLAQNLISLISKEWKVINSYLDKAGI